MNAKFLLSLFLANYAGEAVPESARSLIAVARHYWMAVKNGVCSLKKSAVWRLVLDCFLTNSLAFKAREAQKAQISV